MKHTVEEISLTNGANGVLIDIPNNDVFYCQILFRGGYLFGFDNKKTEIAHFLEHMVFEKNDKHSNFNELVIDFNKNGGYFSASTNKYRVRYLFKCVDSEWRRMLNIQLIMLTTCRFSNKYFLKEKEIIKDELTRRSLDYNIRLNHLLNKEINGYDLSYSSRLKLLDNINLVDLEKFYEKTHYSANLQFVIAGDLKQKKDEIRKILTEANFPNKNKLPVKKHQSEFAQINQPIVLSKSFIKKIVFKIIFVVNRQLSLLEYASLWVAVAILIDGFDSIIYSQIRKRGLGYRLFSDIEQNGSFSSISIQTEMSEGNAVELFQVVTDGLKLALSGKITVDQIEAGKAKVVGGVYNAEPNTTDLAELYIDQYFYTDKLEKHPDKFVAAIKEIDKQMFDETLKSVFHPERWYLGLIGRNVDSYKDDLYKISSEIFHQQI